MKFGTLQITNFLSIGEASVVLDGRGLVNVFGINRDDTSADSNGAGKSSFADALCWALYGTTARGVTGDDVINRAAGKGTRVDVEVIEGDDAWRIVRHRKHKVGKSSLQVFHYAKDGAVTTLTKGTDKLTQDVANAILGCSYDVFCGAVYAGQERMPDLPGMTDKGLKLLVEEAAGVTILEQAYRLALGRVNEGKADSAEKMRVVLDIDRQSKENLARIDELRAQEKAWGDTQAARINVAADAVRANAQRAKDLGTELAKHDKPKLAGQLAAEEARIAGVETEKARLKELLTAETAASRVLSGTEIAFERLKDDAKTARAAIERLDHMVGCPCKSCARPYSAEDIAPAKASATTELTALVAQAREKGTELAGLREAATLATQTREAFEASMTDISETVALCASLRSQIASIENIERQRASVVDQAKAEKARHDALRAEANPYAAMIERETARGTALTERYTTASSAARAAEGALKTLELTAKIFSPAGVRAHILDTVTPFLNDRTALYLGTLSDGNLSATWTTLVRTGKGELREKFSIEVTNATGGERFASISGGEKRKVRIACALALQDLVASRATKPIELFLADEVDDALDPAGLERLMSVLEEKARERGSVFVISHNDLKSWIPNTMTVTKSGGVSTIEEAFA